MEEGMQTPVVDRAESSDDIVVYVKHDPVMQVAVDLLQTFARGRRLVLKARGNSIPNAVAVANILGENMLKGDVKTQNVTVDSEAPPGIGRMVSTIEIVLVRD